MSDNNSNSNTSTLQSIFADALDYFLKFHEEAIKDIQTFAFGLFRKSNSIPNNENNGTNPEEFRDFGIKKIRAVVSNFIEVVDFTEPFIISIFVFHFILFSIIYLTRKRSNIQGLILTICGKISNSNNSYNLIIN